MSLFNLKNDVIYVVILLKNDVIILLLNYTKKYAIKQILGISSKSACAVQAKGNFGVGRYGISGGVLDSKQGLYWDPNACCIMDPNFKSNIRSPVLKLSITTIEAM